MEYSVGEGRRGNVGNVVALRLTELGRRGEDAGGGGDYLSGGGAMGRVSWRKRKADIELRWLIGQRAVDGEDCWCAGRVL